MKQSIVIVAPEVEPVSLGEAKDQLRIIRTDTTYDSEISRKLATARQWVERRYGISCITQTRKQTMNRFPCDGNWNSIRLLYPPIQEADEIEYTDSAGDEQVLVAGDDYNASGLMDPTVGAQDIAVAKLTPVSSWPSVALKPDAVSITYVAGFGDDGTFVPQPVKEAILKKLTALFEQRQDETTETISKFEADVDEIMAGYEVFDFSGVDD